MWPQPSVPYGATRAAPKPRQMLRQKQTSGQLRKDADLDMVLDSLYGPLYYRFLVKNEAPSQKYAEALAALVIRGIASPPRRIGVSR